MDADQLSSAPAQTIDEFCAELDIGKTKYFRDRAAGRGPREFRIGKTVRITAQAKADYIRAHENPTGAEARLIKREREALARLGRRGGKASAASPNHISKQRKRQAATKRLSQSATDAASPRQESG